LGGAIGGVAIFLRSLQRFHLSGNAVAYFREQFHQPEDRSAIRVRLILL
jgi:hypothetical protein